MCYSAFVSARGNSAMAIMFPKIYEKYTAPAKTQLAYTGLPATNWLDILPQQLFEKVMKSSVAHKKVLNAVRNCWTDQKVLNKNSEEYEPLSYLKKKGIIIEGYNDLKSHCARHGHTKTIDTGYTQTVQGQYDGVFYGSFPKEIRKKYCECEYHKIMHGELPVCTSRTGKKFVLLNTHFNDHPSVRALGARFGEIICYDYMRPNDTSPMYFQTWYTTPDHPKAREMILRYGYTVRKDFVFKPFQKFQKKKNNPFSF